MTILRLRALVLGLLVALAGSAADAAIVPSVFGGRVPCVERDGVQFCEGNLARRIESWDGVPLDVNVTLPPASMTGPFPVIVDLHGWSIGKTPGPLPLRALQGYVVVNHSARGFLNSCGFPASRAPDATLSDPNACADRGWTHLADARYEARDTQHLVGLLADEGLIVPDRVGVTGASYGGGQSLILAALRDRVMLPDGSFVPWTSPGGLPMRIAAAAPFVPWSDLAEALTPAGRTLDVRAENPYGGRAGLQKESWVGLLYLAGSGTGFYAPAGADESADLPGWNAHLGEGEPYDGDPLTTAIIDEVTRFHSGYYVDDSVPPAPLFIYNAWTDDLFPATEGLRFFLKTRAHHPSAEIAIHFADGFGHPRAGLAGDLATVNARVEQFFTRHLKGTGDPLPAVETYTQACNGGTVRGPFTASDWLAIHPGEVRLADADPRTLVSGPGDADNAAATDPLNGGPCRTRPATDDPAALTYRLPAASGAGYTMMGPPTVIADLAVSGSFAALVARLWDVAPDGTQTLVTHAPYRPRADNQGPQVFQLHANGWHVADGHVLKLELLTQSPPFVRASTGTFRITVRNVELRIPIAEQPDGGAIQSPAAAVLPPSGPDLADAGVPECGEAPVDDCLTSTRRGVLKVKGGHLRWSWRGTPDADLLGLPGATTAYRACLWNAAGTLVWSGAVPAGGMCAARKKERECWADERRAFRWSSRDGSDGVHSVLLKQRKGLLALRADVAATGTGLRLQLLNGVDGCWESSAR